MHVLTGVAYNRLESVRTWVSALASQSLNLGAMSGPAFDRPPTAVPLDRETLLARFDGIRQFARGGRRAPNKPLLLLYALARLKHDRQTEIRFNATEAIVNPLLRSYGPWGSGAHVSYPYGRLVNDGLWHLPARAQLLDPTGTAAPLPHLQERASLRRAVKHGAHDHLTAEGRC
jgi:hypothetical protein